MVVEHCSRRRTGYGPWYHCLTCALPFSFAPGSFRAGVPGRMAPVGPGRASRRRAVSRLPTGPRSESWGRSRKQRFGPGLSIRETAQSWLVPEPSAPVGEAGRRSLMSGRLSYWVDLPVGDLTVLLAHCVLDSWAGPRTTRCFLGPSPGVEAGP